MNSSDIEDELNKTVFVNNSYVYAWGRNDHGELGIGTVTNNNYLPLPVTSLNNLNVSSISIGGRHALILTEENEIYTCGSDLLGILGLDSFTWKNIPKFKKLESVKNIKFVKVDCGEFHSIGITDDGQTYAWGGNWHSVSLK